MLKRGLALIGCTLLLTGCFDMQQQIAFSGDGTASLDFVMSVDATMVAMGDKDKAFSNFCSDAGVNSKVESQQPGIAITATREDAKGDMVCHVRMQGTEAAMLAMFAKASTTLDMNEPNPMLIKLTRNDDVKRLDGIIGLPGKKTGGKGDRPQKNENPMKGAMMAAFTGRAISFTINAPHIIASSGTINADGTSATHSIPVATLMADDAAPQTVYFEFSTAPTGVVETLKQLFGG